MARYHLLVFVCFFPTMVIRSAEPERKTATACYDSGDDKFSVVDGKTGCQQGRAIVTGVFEDSINQTGWAYLNVEVTGENVDDLHQAYGAGLVEGHLTKELIKLSYLNTLDSYCSNQTGMCQRLTKFLKKNYDWMQKQIKKHSADVYWKQVNFSVTQLQGLATGYEGNRAIGIGDDIVTHPIYFLQLMGDISELVDKLNITLTTPVPKGRGRCSALIKLLPNGSDLLVSHATWSSYSTMLRLQKRYAFRLDAKKVPGRMKIMSGYPGTLSSVDDYVHLSSNMVKLHWLLTKIQVVTETTIENHNRALYKDMRPSSVLTWIRVQIAHRMANSGKTWSSWFSRFNSGTYNNQWMIVDFKRFNVGKQKQGSGLLHVLEQMPGIIVNRDMSHYLVNRTFWSSFNRPYFERIYNVSGVPAMVQKYGDFFSYAKCPRNLIFERDHGKVTDMDSLVKLMRYNNYQTDPLSKCDCTPPYSANAAIAARGDLNLPNGKYPFVGLGFEDMGAIDFKAANVALVKQFKFRAISGPTHDDVPIFDWTTSSLKDKVRHFGQPAIWNFTAVEYDLAKLQPTP